MKGKKNAVSSLFGHYENSFAPFNNNDDMAMAMMMRRHSLMSNAGSVMHPHHHRGSLGFGDGYNNGYTFNTAMVTIASHV